jgi:septum formation protein
MDPAPTFVGPIVLASASPQRQQILTQLGVPYRVAPTDVAEVEVGHPAEVARENARAKARAGAEGAVDDEWTLGVDTVVVVDGEPWGKPVDAADARRMLEALMGREHEVLGGLVLIEPDGSEWELVASTVVRFRTVDVALLDRYIDGREWDGRAGGYAIQGTGAMFIAGIDGDYLNVVGLPVAAMLDMLGQYNLSLAVGAAVVS